MNAYNLPEGQRQARTRWGTQASGAAFDRKKWPFLTEQAQEFLAQQAFCVIAGRGSEQEPCGLLAMMTPGFVQTPDQQTCVLHLDPYSSTSPIFQELRHAQLAGMPAHIGLFFINHATRERLCVQGTAELVIDKSSALSPPLTRGQELRVRLQVQQAFYHCSKYIRTRIPGLTAPADTSSGMSVYPQRLFGDLSQHALTETMLGFIAQQVLCFLCTVDQQGRCAVNHRGGAPGFLVTLPPTYAAPGGIVLLPDYSGNGAFEAIGNIFETKQAALVIPSYTAQVALCLSGPAYVAEMSELSWELAERCPGAERVLALSVQQVEIQYGDWSATLAYERARAQAILTRSMPAVTCSL